MKTFVIQLEEHDDIISVRDKMSWSKSGRILLVLPNRSRAFRRRLDLVLVQRYGQELGARVGLVTRTREVADNAHHLGIPVFESADAAQLKPWRRLRQARQSEPLPSSVRRDQIFSLHESSVSSRTPKALPPAVRLAAFSAGVGAVLLLGLFFLPQARIILPLAKQEQRLILDVWANPDITAMNVSGGLPAQLLRVVVEGQEQLPTTEEVSVPSERAVGWVRLTNLTPEEVEVPSGTVVRTAVDPAIRFIVRERGFVPAGVGSFSDIPVQAVGAGISGNVATGQIAAIEGAIGSRLSVSNPEATSGGMDRLARAPTEDDYQRLKTRLLATLERTAHAELEAMLAPGQTLLAQTIVLKSELYEKREPETGVPAELLTLQLRLEFEGWTLDERDIEAVASAALDATLPRGYLAVTGTLMVPTRSEPSLKDGSMRWRIEAIRQVRADWTRGTVLAAVLGKTPIEASQLLENSIELQSSPHFSLTPRWWQRLPFLPFRIEVVTE